MLRRKEFIEDGDWVVAYESYGSIRSLQVKRGEVFSNQNGSFRHNDMIGKKYGCKLNSYTKLSAAPLIILHTTPQLWTEVLNHRTQILFQLDISLVLYHLCIRPGSVVLEAGTGSASLSHSFARAVAPHGHLHTFEFNLDRVNKARVDIERNGLAEVATVRHRDVCAAGFPLFKEGVDAVFLDLPTPWLAVDDAHRSLRPQGRLCSFSPCIEQVQRTCVRLAELNYEDIITIEVLQKTIEVHRNALRAPDFAASRATAGKNAFKRAAPADKPAASAAADEDATAATTDVPAAKAAKSAEDGATAAVTEQADVQLPAPAADEAAAPVSTYGWSPLTPVAASTVTAPQPWLNCKPHGLMRGHTGYLTFARKASSSAAEPADAADAPAAEAPAATNA